MEKFEAKLLKSDKKLEDGDYIQVCGCRYTYITGKNGHLELLWTDFCVTHYAAGRR